MKSSIPIILASLFAIAANAHAARLSIKFKGGGKEVTLDWDESVQIDVIWTMQPSDTPLSKLHGVNLRFNVNDAPDPDGTDRDDYFIVDSVSTPIEAWTTEITWGIGSFFSEFAFFLSAIHPDGAIGLEGDGGDFAVVIGSFVLRRAGYNGGDTFITLRHLTDQDPLPDATNNALIWELRWQKDVEGYMQYDLGLGNPGDAGGQWAFHGLEPFEPLVIHAHPAVPVPADPDFPPAPRPPRNDRPPPSDNDEDDESDLPQDDTVVLPPADSESDAPPAPPPPADAYEAPDRDGDGVAKNLDLCPFTPRAKSVDANGCSIDDPMRPAFDVDRDGVLDKNDDCPRTMLGRAVDERGCSDAQRDDDRDGVLNGADLCARTSADEEVNGAGCPSSRLDQDADGVADAYDLCPESPSGRAVDAAGCEAEQAAALLQPADPPAPVAQPAGEFEGAAGSGGAACGAIGMVPLLCMTLGLLGMRGR